ncbi:U2 small nuclear ribonucleoprotein auxiliary factor 35 kDa subunit-related protein 1 [Habropoda laboriosa]|uniref:U2 small nuclear ribonucleoprotein auxiliary factor 35 kDa subunit-related protein 1 n=2 Tax=Habropoda laboriosa TaxID=597456 RepID=A0A0L7QSQ8_9HYME|nr:U2 small nuclear ribonucleoprotein auxiliary factor 35 kDa subunit-related protein 1 [Habropoda laboriosa]
MEGRCSTEKSHKEWRRIAKRERRKRLRRRAAAEREADAERLRAALEKSADYLNWLEQCEVEDREKEIWEKEKHDQEEKLWLEEEVRAQKDWQILQERKQKARQLQLEQEAKIREEFEAKQETIRKKQEEDKRKREEDIKKREQLLKEIDDYIDDGIKTPEALREVIDSQPGKDLCPFFTKTGACRYGDSCSRNHRRVCLSKVILVPGFYTHFSLEKNSAEYDTDIALEFESSETRQHFREFYKDVVPELESFGKIKTLKYCCNTEVHLRGNLYVEYYTEREAARALRRLKGRWYAGRQLNCEFVNLKSWRSAVCGMSKCPKGRACNFLHTFKNPHDEYDIKSPPRWMKQSTSGSQESASSRKNEHRNKSKWEVDSDAEDDKNWRWSESPEPEVGHRSRNIDKRHRYSDERDSRQKSTRDKRHEQSDRDKITDNNDQTPVKRRRSRSRKHFEEKTKDDNVSNGRASSRRRSRLKKYQRKREDDNEYNVSPKHSRKSHSRSSDRSNRSKTRKSSSRYSRKEKGVVGKGRQNSRNHSESCEDSSSRKSNDAFEKSSTIEIEGAMPRIKSKWDKENSEQMDSESTSSSDSDFSSVVKERKTKKLELPRRILKRMSEDEWATTDSDGEMQTKENVG